MQAGTPMKDQTGSTNSRLHTCLLVNSGKELVRTWV
jgi:hypothetical protein